MPRREKADTSVGRIAQWICCIIISLLLISNTISAQVTIAHRGGRALAPENTLAAVRNGLSLKADIIEIDVHQTLDSVVIVSHDETLDRCTNGHGRIDHIRWADMQNLDAGGWFGKEFGGEKIPTLDEVLSVMDGKTKLWIELKAGGDYPGIEKRIVDLIHAHKAENWAQVISFDGKALKKVHDLDSNIVVHKLMVSNLTLLPWYMDTGLHWGNPKKLEFVDGFIYHHKFVRKPMVKRLHARNQTLMVWTVNSPKRIQKLKKIGVDGIETDDPRLMNNE